MLAAFFFAAVNKAAAAAVAIPFLFIRRAKI